MFKRDKSIKVSLPEKKVVHGIEIKKFNISQYILALKEIDGLQSDLLSDSFKGEDLSNLLEMLSKQETSKIALLNILGKIMTRSPEKVVEIACKIMGIDENKIMNDFTPGEFLDVVLAFWELNDLSDFFGKVWELVKRKLLTQNIGCNVG